MSQTAEILLMGSAELARAEWLEKIDLIKATVAVGATDAELDLFLHTAAKRALDPLAKQIYFVKRQGKGTIQVGIDGFRAIAHRTGRCAGISDAAFAEKNADGYPSAASVTVHRITDGTAYPYAATARWEEYFPGDQQGFQWKRMPFAMLAKCAEALALRKAFPEDMSGLYEHSEMEQAGKSEAITVEARDLSGSDAVEEQIGTYARHQPQEARGTALVDAAKEIVASESGVEGKNAFGYVPQRWPVAKMFSEPATESQAKISRAKARDRMLDVDEIDLVRRLVLGAYGLEDDASKAGMSLFVDWLMNAEDDSLDKASAAAEALPRNNPEDL